MTSAEESSPRPVVLVADDEPDILDLVRFRLEREGLEVLAARDGREALDLAREHRPAVSVLDVMMPKLSGLEVLARLRNDPETAHLRVIMLTARSQEADVDDGFDTGADDYIIKPFSPHELRQRVRAQLAR